MNSAKKWVLIDGDRLIVASLFVIGSFLVTYGLTTLGLITFRPASAVSTMFGSGIVSGIFSLITITLTVNQMILSRVFGTINGLTDRIDGSLDFRHTVEDLAGKPGSPNQPDKFLVLIGETITERANAFENALSETDRNAENDIDEYLSDVRTYASNIESVEGTEDTLQIVSTLLGPAYAQNLTATDRLLRTDNVKFSEEARDELESILELIKSVAIARQFFKTIAIQQDLAQLSRLLAYIGVPVLLGTFLVTTMYTTIPSTTVAQPLLAEVVSLGIAIVFIPVSILLSFILRAASVARYTVSVGPFVPPEEQL
ncbi:hypothetical protein [Halocatena marina]|uniref:Type II secretion system protein GspF domain-containing protein n=1 Tax=Halocatena marina TaxID=2934937 RepID=A0ABD5YNE3_9EURY|nr:hypothetical protein [Halocatena marina]